MDLKSELSRKSLLVAQTGRLGGRLETSPGRRKSLKTGLESRRSALQTLKPTLMTGFRQRFMRKIDGRQRPAKDECGPAALS
jgi:hypothetical protein